MTKYAYLKHQRITTYREWLIKFGIWLDNPTDSNYNVVQETASRLKGMSRGGARFLSVALLDFPAFSKTLLDSFTLKQPGNLGVLIRELAMLPISDYPEKKELLEKVIAYLHTITVPKDMVVKVGVFGTRDDYAVEVINENIDINLTKENGEWKLITAGSSGRKESKFDFRLATKFIVNVEYKHAANGKAN